MKAGRNTPNQLALKRHLACEERHSLPKLVLQCKLTVWPAQLGWTQFAFILLFSAYVLYLMYLFLQLKLEQLTFLRGLLYEFWKVVNGGLVKFWLNYYSQAQTSISIQQHFPFALAEPISEHAEHWGKVQLEKRNISERFSVRQSSWLFLHSQTSIRSFPFKKAWCVLSWKTTFPFLQPGISQNLSAPANTEWKIDIASRIWVLVDKLLSSRTTSEISINNE